MLKYIMDVVAGFFRAETLRKRYLERYAAHGGKPYVPMMLCAEKPPEGTWTWGSPDRFWDGPPAPKAKDIEAWEEQNKKNQLAREWAYREVYENKTMAWQP